MSVLFRQLENLYHNCAADATWECSHTAAKQGGRDECRRCSTSWVLSRIERSSWGTGFDSFAIRNWIYVFECSKWVQPTSRLCRKLMCPLFVVLRSRFRSNEIPVQSQKPERIRLEKCFQVHSLIESVKLVSRTKIISCHYSNRFSARRRHNLPRVHSVIWRLLISLCSFGRSSQTTFTWDDT